jgi:histone H3/H4
VQKLISELLPSELTFAKESRDLLIDCCVEFIHLVSSEANEICERETKKTISADHVVKALVELGFEDYVQEIQDIAVEHKEQQKVSFKHSVEFRLTSCRFAKRSKTSSTSRECRRRSCRECRRNCWVSQEPSLNRHSIARTSEVARESDEWKTPCFVYRGVCLEPGNVFERFCYTRATFIYTYCPDVLRYTDKFVWRDNARRSPRVVTST